MITIKNSKEIEYMRHAGKIVGDTLALLEESIKPGITTKDLDRIAEEYIRKCNAIPSFKGYYGFPASVCTSVNEEVRSEEHTSELQSRQYLVCRLLLEKK